MPPKQPGQPKRTPQEQDDRDQSIPRPAAELGLIVVSQTLWLPVWHKVAATPPIKVVGYQLLEFADFGDGADIRPGEILLASRTVQTDRTVGKALTQIRAWGLIWRYREGSRHGRQRLSDEYRLTIPADLLTRVPLTGTIPQDFLKRLGLTGQIACLLDHPNDVPVIDVRVKETDHPNVANGSPEPRSTDHPNDVRPTFLKDQVQDLSPVPRGLYALLAAVVPDVTEREIELVRDMIGARRGVQSAAAVLRAEIRDGNGPSLVAQVRRHSAASAPMPSGGSPSDVSARALCGRCGAAGHPKERCPTLADMCTADSDGGRAA
jgi:hypothetical protein